MLINVLVAIIIIESILLTILLIPVGTLTIDTKTDAVKDIYKFDISNLDAIEKRKLISIKIKKI